MALSPMAISRRASLALTELLVPKSRRPKFDLTLRILDLNNVPLVSGTSFIKWYIAHSTSAEHRGRTDKKPIKDHKVIYDYEKTFPVRLTVAKDNKLQELWMHFEVLQEYSGTGRGERITLGLVKLNLAEYVEDSESGPKDGGSAGGPDGGEEGIVRRYLMQESKINSTLKIGITMKQIEGEKNFSAPQLKTAPVFGNIAGIMSAEPSSTDVPNDLDPSNLPSLTSKSREQSSLQDMYRRTLAAYWTAQPGELAADDCIEDIFSGGDGWGNRTKASTHLSPSPGNSLYLGSGDHSDDGVRKHKVKGFGGWFSKAKHHERHGSGDSMHSGLHMHREGGQKPGLKSLGKDSVDGMRRLEGMGIGKEGFGSQKDLGASKARERRPNEVEEEEVREDLRSWVIGPAAKA